MTGFKLRTSGVRSDRSANWATTTEIYSISPALSKLPMNHYRRHVKFGSINEMRRDNNINLSLGGHSRALEFVFQSYNKISLHFLRSRTYFKENQIILLHAAPPQSWSLCQQQILK